MKADQLLLRQHATLHELIDAHNILVRHVFASGQMEVQTLSDWNITVWDANNFRGLSRPQIKERLSIDHLLCTCVIPQFQARMLHDPLHFPICQICKHVVIEEEKDEG